VCSAAPRLRRPAGRRKRQSLFVVVMFGVLMSVVAGMLETTGGRACTVRALSG
jgi:hypothetical protein